MNNSLYHRVFGLGLGLMLMLPLSITAFPRQAHADLLGIGDAMLVAKEYGLDGIAWLVAKAAIQSMTRSTVNWINSGFEGSPSFVTNLDEHLLNLGDVAATRFVTMLATDPALNSPFQSRVAKAAYTGYLLSTSKDAYVKVNGYTLNQTTRYDREFLNGDFSKGGWDSWLSAVMNPQNNPYEAEYLAANGLNVKVKASQDRSIIELNWGQGFLSWCGSNRTGADNNANAGGDEIGPLVSTSQVNFSSVCRNEDGTPGYIQTPGSVIQNQINQTLGLSGEQLVTADEFNEIIGALISQLTSQVLGGVGLSGASQPSSGGGRSFIDQATDSTSYGALSTNAAGSLSSAVAAQRSEILMYERDWNVLATVANSSSCSSEPIAIQTRAQAATAQTQINATLTGLDAVDALIVKATSTTGRAAIGQDSTVSQLQAAAQEFERVMSKVAPTAAQIELVRTESLDNSNEKDAKPTLLTNLKAECD